MDLISANSQQWSDLFILCRQPPAHREHIKHLVLNFYSLFREMTRQRMKLKTEIHPNSNHSQFETKQFLLFIVHWVGYVIHVGMIRFPKLICWNFALNKNDIVMRPR